MSELQLPFINRQEAGQQLAKRLLKFTAKKRVLVLALVRGGVIVGQEVSRALSLPIYPYIVRKIGHPLHREFALGAIAEQGATYMDEITMTGNDVSWSDVEPIIDEEMEELRRRREIYLAVVKRPGLRGKEVILVDDGAATGATLIAAIQDLRKQRVKSICVAIPVCPPDAARAIEKRANESVILRKPFPFGAVGEWYLDFPQVSDSEIVSLLQLESITS